jgi:hypothetical protein
VPKPLSNLGIGVDAIPSEIKESRTLTGNDLGKLGNVESLPKGEEIAKFIAENKDLADLVKINNKKDIHTRAQLFLEKNNTDAAWKLLLAKID